MGQNKRIKPVKTLFLIGQSPDFLDMLLMRMYFEIQPKAVGVATARIVPRKR